MAHKFVPFNQLPTPVPGDLLEFNRGKYMHWAMYSDKPGYVFNIDAESKNNTEALISLKSLAEVANTSGIRVNNMGSYAKAKGLRTKSGAEACTAARKDLGNKVPYNFVGCNCEYYATKWKYGEGFSGQVKLNRSKGFYLSSLGAGTTVGAAVGSVVPVAGTFTGAMVGGIAGQVVGLSYVAYDYFTSTS